MVIMGTMSQAGSRGERISMTKALAVIGIVRYPVCLLVLEVAADLL